MTGHRFHIDSHEFVVNFHEKHLTNGFVMIMGFLEKPLERGIPPK
jgi:hypothetical protein